MNPHPTMKLYSDPIATVRWVEASRLYSNTYNPNVVQDAELDLIATSILTTGWTQPIIVSADLMIIDGFHRWRTALENKEINEKYSGMVPCVFISCGEPEAMMLTIRMNRARGTHMAVRMSDIVKKLIDEFCVSREEISTQIGASLAEVNLLYQDSIFVAKGLKNYRYSKAWVPAENGKRGAPVNEGYDMAEEALGGD